MVKIFVRAVMYKHVHIRNLELLWTWFAQACTNSSNMLYNHYSKNLEQVKKAEKIKKIDFINMSFRYSNNSQVLQASTNFNASISSKSENLTSVSNNSKQEKPNLIRRYIIVGERRLSNYWWTSVIFLGACGFLYTGVSSFLGQNLFNSIFGFANSLSISSEQTSQIVPFFPQGLLMSFYGSLGLLLSVYWSLLIFWNVGGGFNEFNKKDGFIRVFRWGYPGKNRKIDLMYNLKDVEAIRVELKQGLDPQRTIYLKLKGSNPLNNQQKPSSVTTSINNAMKREIPLTGISQPLTLKEIEKQASELANFLQVSLEGL